MRKSNHITILITFIISIFFISCQSDKVNPTSPPIKNQGKVLLRFYKTNIPTEIKTIVAVLLRNNPPMMITDSLVINNYNSDTLLLNFNNVPAGNWLLKVLAKDSLSNIRYMGELYVTIYPDQTTDAYVVMYPIYQGGVGNLNIYIIWNIHSSNWKMSNKNPIIKQSPGSWDGNLPYIKSPTVIKDGNLYKMWYICGDNNVQQIALAISNDGVNWQKQGLVIKQGSIGSILEYGSDGCSVLKEGNYYKMWLNSKSYNNKHNGIAYATSTDGINWTILPNTVISTSSSKPHVFSPSVIKKDDFYYMYYSVMNDYDTQPRIYLATSSDGINWNDLGVVLSARNEVSWEAGGVFCPSVIYKDNKFIMYYTSKRSPNSFDIGYIGKALSNDGVNWTHSSLQPELSNLNTQPWLTTSVAYPSVIEDNGKLKMYFSGISIYNNMYQIGLAEEK